MKASELSLRKRSHSFASLSPSLPISSKLRKSLSLVTANGAARKLRGYEQPGQRAAAEQRKGRYQPWVPDGEQGQSREQANGHYHPWFQLTETGERGAAIQRC